MSEEKKEMNAHIIYLFGIPRSPWLCGIFCAMIYIFFLCILHPNVFQSTHFAYYNLLADAFLHGRTDILPGGNVFDVSFFKEKWYLYWGASPLLFVFPFFLIGNGIESDVLYTFIAGVLNIFIFILVVKEFLRFTKNSLSPFLWWVIIGSFALASPNFYLSLDGRIWHTAQIIPIFYLLLFLWFFFRFLNEKKIVLLILAIFFFNLAWLGRLPLLLYGVLFVYILKKNNGVSKKHLLLCVSLGIMMGDVFFGWYNIQRFGSPFETGARFQQAHPRYQEDMTAGTFLSLKNIPHNARYYFIESPFSLRPPFLSFIPEGTSIFFVYPITIFFLFSLFKKRKSPSFQEFLPYAYTILTFLMIFLLLFLGTGWYQFGSRYFFDCIPLVFLCAIPFLQTARQPVLYFFLAYEILINLLGSILFYTVA